MPLRTIACAAALLASLTIAADGLGASAAERRLTIFYTAEIHGAIEPCGCTSDPLGDVARYAALVKGAYSPPAPALLVDAGGLSYPEGGLGKGKAAAELRARFLAHALGGLGVPAAFALADTDLAAGAAEVMPRRVAVNLPPAPELVPSLVQTVGGVRVAVLGVADPALADRLHVRAEDPITAATREVRRLRAAGAELVIALAPLDRPVARRLAREAAPDFVVLGRQVGHGAARAEPVGRAFIVASADELQKVGRLDVVWRGGGPLTDAGGPEAAAARRAEIDQAMARIDGDLASWTARGGDPAFIAARRAERDGLLAERRQLDAPLPPPASGSYFTNHLIALRRSLPRDPAVAADMRRLDAQVAAVNLKTAPPPAPREPGRPYYVGAAKCAACHAQALAFWRTTVHATAWRTLVAAGKQNDDRCVGCHVTGYGQVGGSSLGHTDRLRDVQCEVCHGPASAHVAAKGLEEPPAVRKQVPASTCTACHTEQHSDTFAYEAYLRDVLGPGHGAAARAKLGDGPTGHGLRSAALARAASSAAADRGGL